MRTLNSQVLSLGQALAPPDDSQLGFSWRQTSADRNLNFAPETEVVILTDFEMGDSSFYDELKKKAEARSYFWLVLACHETPSPLVIQKWANDLPLIGILINPSLADLQKQCLAAFEKNRWKRQQEELEKLFIEQRQKLEKLKADLKLRIDKRVRYLQDSQTKLVEAQSRLELLRSVTFQIHQATSLWEIEKILYELLAPRFELQQLRLHLGAIDQNQLPRFTGLEALTLPLFDSLENRLGWISFFRLEGAKWLFEEKEFLQQICETLNLALSRLVQLKTRETFKEEWEATFNAVSDPVALIDSLDQVIQTNQAFDQQQIEAFRTPQTKCFQALFGRSSPCLNCQKGQTFQIENEGRIWEVSSQALAFDSEEQSVFVHQYHEVTEETRIKRRIIETAKLSELGTIGSSIAHELNNPLAGLLSYVQLLKMDLKSDHPLWPDLEEMERGALRCRDIIQNLLSFSRRESPLENQKIDLRTALERAVKLIELKSKSLGIETRCALPETPCWVRGNQNLLVQAFQNVLQTCFKSLQSLDSENSSTQVKWILVELEELPKNFQIQMTTNGRTTDLSPSLDIPLAQRILTDQGATLEFFLSDRKERTYRAQFPKKSSF